MEQKLYQKADKCEEIGYKLYLDCVEKLEEFPDYMRASATNAVATAYLQEHCCDDVKEFFAIKMIVDCQRILDEMQKKTNNVVIITTNFLFFR